jgi:hypothetical protein
MQGLTKPIYQVMASGMDKSTAEGLQKCSVGETCCGWQKDVDGLRGPGKVCNIFGDPNFGVAEFDWSRRTVHLSIQRGDGKGVASGADGAPIEMRVNIDTCEQV